MVQKWTDELRKYVQGLSPVNGAIVHDVLKPYRRTKYWLILPKLAPPSSGTWPSLLSRSLVMEEPAARAISF